VLPSDLARGAQRYARAVADAAGRIAGQQHDVVVLFAVPNGTGGAEHELAVPSGRLRRAGLDPRAVWRLRQLVARTRPDVVIAHGAESLKYAAFLPRNGPALVCHAIGVSSPKATQGWAGPLYRRLYRRAGLVTAVSSAVADELATVFSVPLASLRVVPNARDPQVFRPRAGGPPDPFRLAFVGHLTGTKRPERFLDVVERVQAAGHRLDAVVIGDGPLRASLTRRAAASRVRMAGARNDVAAVLPQSSALLFTSVAEGEGMPGVLIEAALCGLPVVATDVPGVRDVVRDGETGFVVGVDDVDGLTAGVLRLLTDPATTSRMALAARRDAESRFALEQNAAVWADLVTVLAGSRQQRHR
jgi:glycosyltransferase involved in cell wall biosynthesis